MRERYNWWDDPKNKKEVDRISWWNHEQNKTTVSIPVSVIKSDNYWVIANNADTDKLLGDGLAGCAQGDTKEDAVSKWFQLIKLIYEYNEDRVRSYQRWVPFRKGMWGRMGGNWFVIFGFHFYFRIGENMKGGWYIPFTKLNISVYSEWASYNRYRGKLKSTNNEKNVKTGF